MQKKESFLNKNSYRIITLIALITLLVGTIFYHIVEKLNWIDSWYLSVITLATVGYGDFTPKTDLGKLFTTIYVLIGIGIIVAFTSSLIRRASERREKKLEERNKNS